MILLWSPQFRVTMTVFGGGGVLARFGRLIGGVSVSRQNCDKGGGGVKILNDK